MPLLRKALSDFGIHLLTSRTLSWVMQPLRSQVVPVFMLHRMEDASRAVPGHSVDSLERALQYLKDHDYNVVSVRELVVALQNHQPLPKRAVAFTMDDGFYDQASMALPLFEHYQAPVTVFLATDMLDHQKWSWDYQVEYLLNKANAGSLELKIGSEVLPLMLGSRAEKRLSIRQARAALKSLNLEQVADSMGDLALKVGVDVPEFAPPSYQPMTWGQAARLESNVVEFGPHSRQHLILSQLPEDEAEAEIRQSWATLCEHLKHPVPVFCYPNGRFGKDFTQRDQKLVQRAGLQAAFSADPGYVNLGASVEPGLFAMKRFAFPERFVDFKQYCSWLENGKEKFFPGRR
ncbi:MAG: polysaccharide deacetylase family protein [Saccharospirillum sp.]|nr:polysaccharide deacetylase family protein [Saccharospirillum sp.]